MRLQLAALLLVVAGLLLAAIASGHAPIPDPFAVSVARAGDDDGGGSGSGNGGGDSDDDGGDDSGGGDAASDDDSGGDGGSDEAASDDDGDDGGHGRGRGRGRKRGGREPARETVFSFFGRLAGQRRDDRDPPPPALLAVDPSAAELEVLRARGFRVRDAQTLLGLDLGVVRLQPPAGMSPERAEELLRSLLPGRPVDRDARYRLQEGACRTSGCWPLQLVGWRADPRCVPRRPIGMIDTGVAVDDPRLAGASIRVEAFAGGSPPHLRAHGTAIAGLLVGTGVPALLPGAPLLVADVFGEAAGGDETGAFEIALGLDWLVREGANVVNLALAGPANAVLEAAVRRARGRGTHLVAAAGNDGPAAPPAWPAAYPEVVAVTAVDRGLAVYAHANRGPWIDFAAPGVGVPVLAAGGGMRQVSGTSFATVFVTAALARLLADADGRGLPPVARLARDARDLGPPGRDPVYGHGLVPAVEACAGGAGTGARAPRRRLAGAAR